MVTPSRSIHQGKDPVPLLRDGAKKRASSARTVRGKILNLMAVRLRGDDIYLRGNDIYKGAYLQDEALVLFQRARALS